MRVCNDQAVRRTADLYICDGPALSLTECSPRHEEVARKANQLPCSFILCSEGLGPAALCVLGVTINQCTHFALTVSGQWSELHTVCRLERTYTVLLVCSENIGAGTPGKRRGADAASSLHDCSYGQSILPQCWCCTPLRLTAKPPLQQKQQPKLAGAVYNRDSSAENEREFGGTRKWCLLRPSGASNLSRDGEAATSAALLCGCLLGRNRCQAMPRLPSVFILPNRFIDPVLLGHTTQHGTSAGVPPVRRPLEAFRRVASCMRQLPCWTALRIPPMGALLRGVR